MPKIKKLTLSAILFSIGLILPFITMQIPTIGSMLSPLHIPVLMAGFVLDSISAMIIGIILPVFRGLIFMIPRFPTAFFMVFELGAYGLVSGLIFNKVFKRNFTYFNIYVTLITSMIIGRVMFGIAKYIAFKYILDMSAYTLVLWVSDVFISSIPGIIIQLLLIPMLMMILHKRGNI